MTSKNKTIAIVEARMTSSRLPGKHLLGLSDTTVIRYLLRRLIEIKEIDRVAVAMTDRKNDDMLEEHIQTSGLDVDIFRGDEHDVLSRVLGCAETNEARVVCEVTGDCPLIDIELISQCVRAFHHNSCDYVNNGELGLPDGMGCQVFSLDCLRRSAQATCKPEHREHVTLHIRENREIFRCFSIPPLRSHLRPDVRVTLDTDDDYHVIRTILEYLQANGLHASINNVIEAYDYIKR